MTEQSVVSYVQRSASAFPKRNLLKKIDPSGSIRQGSFSSSLFNPSSREKGEKICKEMDIDITLVGEEELKSSTCLRDVEGKLGLVEVRSKCLTNVIHDKLKYNWTKTEFIQHYWLKELILIRLVKLEVKEMREFKNILASYLRSQKRKFKTIETKLEISISKATSQKLFDILVDSKTYWKIKLDFSYLIETKFTPKVLQEFSERTPYNLSPSVLDHLFIVAKSSHEEKSNKNTTEWSYSFCHIENHIFTDVFTDTHNLIYLVTKSIFKKHIQPLDDNLLTSYLIKTVSFWRFESEKFSQDDWFNDTMILSQTQIMFKDLKRFLEKGFLPMYFIPKLNLIETMDTKLRNAVIDVIENKILKSSFKELFIVDELEEAQKSIQDFTTFAFYVKEKIEFVKSLTISN